MSAKKKRTKKVYPKPAVPVDDLAHWNRCVYCGSPVSVEAPPFIAEGRTRRFPACSAQCKSDTERYIQKDRKRKVWLYLILMACAVIVLISVFSGYQGPLMYSAVLLAGVGFLAFPYPITTFETFQSCCIRRVTRITQVLGAVLLLLSLVFLFFA